jgi:predicted lipid carrier protein YhbT
MPTHNEALLEALDIEHHRLQQKLAGDAILLLRRRAFDPLGARDLPHQLCLERAVVTVVVAARLDANARQIGAVLDLVALLAQGRVDSHGG